MAKGKGIDAGAKMMDGGGGNDISEEIRGLQTEASANVLQRAVVVEVISDLSLRDDDQWEEIRVQLANPDFLDSCPRNSIVARVITGGQDKRTDSILLCYPFFPPHLCFPIKAGEQVWLINESPDDMTDIGYWMCRIPEADPIDDVNYLLSPADGVVSQIVETNGPIEMGMENKKFIRVSIFMNVFNCHVNRAPLKGEIEDIFYKPGKFLNASLDKASEENERNYFKIKDNKTADGIVVVQIAGLIARRIVTQVQKKQTVNQGQRIGMIRFGSRVDVYYNGRKTMVKAGQNVIAGESLIASS